MQTRDDHRGGRARLLASAALGLALVAAIGTRGAARAAPLLPPPDWQDFEGLQEWPRLAMDDRPPTVLPVLPLPPVPERPPEEEILSAMPLPEVVTLPPVRSSSWPALLTAGPRSYYALAEILAIQRDNQSCNVPLVVNAITGDTLLTTEDLNPGMALGGRAFVGFRNADGRGLEAGYLGAYGMTAERTLTGEGDLQLAGFLNTQVLPFQEADAVTATYVSSVNSAELNLFASCCGCGDRGGCVVGPGGVEGCGGWCIDWLGGFRYVNVAEQAGLVFTCCTTTPVGPFTSNYDVRTNNNLLGGQFGGRARRSWKSWAIEGWAKTGVFANVASQSQSPVIDPTGTGTVVRDARGGSGVEPAMLADLNLSVIYRINRVWGIRVGYNAIWIGGVALAPEQWNFTTDGDAGYALVQNGGIFMNGANLGLEARW